jgi:hypothetical protein
MLLLKPLFVAASLITQAYVFRESPDAPPASSPSEAGARRADSTLYVTYGIFPPGGRDRSTAGSDTLPTGEPCALR